MFIEFPDKVKAEYAKGVLNGYKLDKNHVFSALLFNEARNFQKPQENWQPPKPTPYNDVVSNRLFHYSFCKTFICIYSISSTVFTKDHLI